MILSGLKTKLQNPLALVVEGFVAGCILFWAAAPDKSSAAVPLHHPALIVAAQHG